MTNVGRVDLLRRVGTLIYGRARKRPSDVETAALFLLRERSPRAVIGLLAEISRAAGVRTFRPAVLRSCIEALRLASGTEGPNIPKAAIQIREQNRLLGRPLPKRAIGSTLLLKGLEAENVVIVNAEALDVRNLYVALTRASKAIVVCSKSPVLRPTA
jgi:DNA helicase-2/ATP-dependent DNA helicase PcrA